MYVQSFTSPYFLFSIKTHEVIKNYYRNAKSVVKNVRIQIQTE